jgi:hypothetical protein
MILYVVVYTGGPVNTPLVLVDVEEQILSGTLPSEISYMFGRDYYFSFEHQILVAHYHFLKQTYSLSDKQIFRSG